MLTWQSKLKHLLCSFRRRRTTLIVRAIACSPRSLVSRLVQCVWQRDVHTFQRRCWFLDWRLEVRLKWGIITRTYINNLQVTSSLNSAVIRAWMRFCISINEVCKSSSRDNSSGISLPGCTSASRSRKTVKFTVVQSMSARSLDNGSCCWALDKWAATFCGIFV